MRILGAILVGCVFVMGACGGTQEQPAQTLDGPIDFSFAIEKSVKRLSDYRGRPVVLVLMRTSEVVSQVYIQHVREAYLKTAGRLIFVVLTIEPTEAPFVEAYASFEKLPFPIGVAEEKVLYGKSVLGVLPGVPMTYFLDETGHVDKVIAGVVEKKELIEKARRLSR